MTSLRPTVQPLVGNPQVLEHAAVDDRLFDDPRHVGQLHAAVPDRLRIDDDGRAELALVQAAGGVGPDQRFEAAPLQFAS